VPFVIAGPGVPHGTDDRFVTNTDIAPTVLQIAGGGPQTDRDGRSLVPILLDDAATWRDDFLVEYNGTPRTGHQLHTFADVQAALAQGVHGVPTYRALRTEQYLYVEWYGGPEHEYELYDLDADPSQLTNLVGTPDGGQQHAELTANLQARLAALAACSGESCRN
jgi:N-acetylglucosamine-6-sulfatase